jgi:hypothetical protein
MNLLLRSVWLQNALIQRAGANRCYQALGFGFCRTRCFLSFCRANIAVNQELLGTEMAWSTFRS